jgi:hypothetical protein
MSQTWTNAASIGAREYTCGYCGRAIASVIGYRSSIAGHCLYICPNCGGPTYFYSGGQLPGVAPGAEVAGLPSDVDSLYREARNCVAASCFTGATLVARKLLMNIAVSKGASPEKSFAHYVDHLHSAGYIPPNGKGWVDHIRKKGNEATHEIVLSTKADADDLITFLEMLLKFIYEFPHRIPTATP